jgi:hypothetical protein
MLLIFLALGLSQTTAKPVDWKGMIPAIRSALKAKFPDQGVEEHYSIGILRPAEIADVTGDGVSEALVWLGTGGATTSEMAVMRIENDKPVVALFKARDGKISPMTFLRGAGVLHGDNVQMLPEKRAIYSSHYSYDGSGKLDECTGEAYTWNFHDKMFVFNLRMRARLHISAPPSRRF